MSRRYEWPIGVRMVDLSVAPEPLTGLAGYSRVRVFVTRRAELVGSVDIWNRGADTISARRLVDEIAARFATELFRQDLRTELANGAGPSQQVPIHLVSVIVPTCGRLDDLRRLLMSLLAQRTRHSVEIVVVDNRPSIGTAAAIAREFPSVRVVVEHRPGLSYARNTGILHAKGSIVVATDDDVVAAEDWIEKLIEPFARPDVMAVTGHVLPLELDTEAQCRFEAYGGLGKGFERFEANGEWFNGRQTAVPTWMLGATANAAFRRSIFARPEIGMLDEALGAGTPTGCSEDTYLFYRILRAGHTIVYEPSAYVWHRHRRTMKDLRSQLYAYSKGHVAYQLTTWLRDGDRRALMRLLYSLPKTYVHRTWQRLRRWSEYPLSLIGLEILGNLAGPLALWRSRRRVRRLGTSERARAERTNAVSLESQPAQAPANQPALAAVDGQAWSACRQLRGPAAPGETSRTGPIVR